MVGRFVQLIVCLSVCLSLCVCERERECVCVCVNSSPFQKRSVDDLKNENFQIIIKDVFLGLKFYSGFENTI